MLFHTVDTRYVDIAYLDIPAMSKSFKSSDSVPYLIYWK